MTALPAETDDQSAAIGFLSDPRSHAGAGVDRIDTHISVVFLAGDRVYKLKRAVDLPFLDYGTPEKRRACCEREVELNRRTAPDMYLGVRAITRGSDGTLTFDGEGEALDWVVEMVRFDAEGLFDRRAQDGTLDRDAVVGAVEAVAALHRRAVVVDAPGDWLADTVDELADSLPAYHEVFETARADRYANHLAAAYATQQELMAARADGGQVRLCHGDLHLKNICTFNGQATLFDAAEANESFMRIDVLYDLAFLLMDLEHRGLAGFANAGLNRYLGECHSVADTLDGLAALPLFLSLRAAIRARVSAMTRDTADDEQTAAQHAAAANEYLSLAEALLAPPPPALVAIGGPSGTGKSTLARALAPALGAAPGAVIVRADSVRKSLFGVGETERLPESAYTPEWHARTYEAMAERARRTLAAGHACIVDAVHGSEADRTAVRDLAERAGVRFCGVWLEAPADVLRARVEGRRGDASDADADVLAGQLQRGFGDIDWQRLDVTGTADDVADAGRGALRGSAVEPVLRASD